MRANNLEMLYRIAFSKTAVEGILMWGFWAGSHWLGSNAAIVNLKTGPKKLREAAVYQRHDVIIRDGKPIPKNGYGVR